MLHEGSYLYMPNYMAKYDKLWHLLSKLVQIHLFIYICSVSPRVSVMHPSVNLQIIRTNMTPDFKYTFFKRCIGYVFLLLCENI